MKTMKKLVAFFAAATMAMSMGISAYADVIEPDINEDLDELIINVSTTSDEQLTMMAYLVPDTTTADNIPDYNPSLHTMIALDQVAGDPGFTTVPINTEMLEDGKVIAIKIGGTNFEFAEALIVYDLESEDPITYILGDIDGNGTVENNDIVKFIVYGKTGTSDYAIGQKLGNTNYLLGDIDGNGIVENNDIVKFIVYGKTGTSDYAIGQPLK